MSWFVVSLVVLSPAILYGLALIATAVKQKWFPRFCPKCNRRGLQMTDFIRASSRSSGDWWSEFRCKLCEAKLTLNRNNQWEDGWRSQKWTGTGTAGDGER